MIEKDEIDDIIEDLKNPFDYGSPEYLKVLEKIKANREKYRQEKTLERYNKYHHLTVSLDDR